MIVKLCGVEQLDLNFVSLATLISLYEKFGDTVTIEHGFIVGVELEVER